MSRPKYNICWADGKTMHLGTQTRVMGILNLTPDSFSDGGQFYSDTAEVSVDKVLKSAETMLAAGADVLDVGAESTRPGAAKVTRDEELSRLLPSIQALRTEFPEAVLSLDTRSAEVAAAGLSEGIDWINDVSGGESAAMRRTVMAHQAPLVCMHMRGTPQTMQSDVSYKNLIADLCEYLSARAKTLLKEGLHSDKILLDPGIGFGKSTEGNITILRGIPSLLELGFPILIGASRKRFIGEILDLPVEDRLEGSLAVAAMAAWQGAHIVRVHDVKETKRVMQMVDAIQPS